MTNHDPRRRRPGGPGRVGPPWTAPDTVIFCGGFLYRLGDSETEAQERLLADRWQHTLHLGLTRDVEQLQATQPSELAALLGGPTTSAALGQPDSYAPSAQRPRRELRLTRSADYARLDSRPR